MHDSAEHDSAESVEEQLARVCDEADRLCRELHAVKDVARNRLQLIDQLKAEKRTVESNARYWEKKYVTSQLSSFTEHVVLLTSGKQVHDGGNRDGR